MTFSSVAVKSIFKRIKGIFNLITVIIGFIAFDSILLAVCKKCSDAFIFDMLFNL